MECRHLDGDPSNNELANLKWGTASENQRDRARHGTSNAGERCAHAKLKETDVIEIRCLSRLGMGNTQLAKAYGVTQPTINDIVHRRTWRSVS